MLCDVPCADVRSHNQDGVLEIYMATLRIGENTVLQNLQQEVEYIRMSLFYFVKQDDGVWLRANLIGQLTALIVTNIAGRRTNQTGHRVLLHVLGHIQTNHGVFIPKDCLSQRFAQLCFTNTGWTQEDKGTGRTLRIF